MEESYSAKYLIFEKKYWWFKGRRDIISKLLDGYKRDSTILDIGCSGGFLLELLKKKGFCNIVGIDISKDAIKHCKDPAVIEWLVSSGAQITSEILDKTVQHNNIGA